MNQSVYTLVMNLLILHYSFINHQFHHSTITIKQKIIINKLVRELLEVIFCEKIVVQMKNVKIPRKKDKFRGKKPNSAGKKTKYRGFSRYAENCRPYIFIYIYISTYMYIHIHTYTLI